MVACTMVGLLWVLLCCLRVSNQRCRRRMETPLSLVLSYFTIGILVLYLSLVLRFYIRVFAFPTAGEVDYVDKHSDAYREHGRIQVR